jgi:hypothetical protein
VGSNRRLPPLAPGVKGLRQAWLTHRCRQVIASGPHKASDCWSPYDADRPDGHYSFRCGSYAIKIVVQEYSVSGDEYHQHDSGHHHHCGKAWGKKQVAQAKRHEGSGQWDA